MLPESLELTVWAQHSSTGNWLLSQTVTGFSGWVKTTWNMSCCEPWTSFASGLNFKRNIMYLVCRSLLKIKTEIFSQCQRMKKLNCTEPSVQWNFQSTGKSHLLFKRILSLKSSRSRSYHEPPRFAKPPKCREDRMLADVGWGELHGSTHPCLSWSSFILSVSGGDIHKSCEH